MQYNISTPVDHNMKNNCNGTSSFLDNDFDDDNDDGDQSKLLSSLFDDDANDNDNVTETAANHTSAVNSEL